MSRLSRLVVGVVLTGVAAQLLVGLLVHDAHAVAPLPTAGGWLAAVHGWRLVAAMAVLTFAGDWVNVRVRHGEEAEELTLFEAAVVVDVLVLPGVASLLVPVAATVLCSAVRRRGLVKVAFNGGNLAAAVAVLVGVVHAVALDGGGLSVRTVLGLTLGMLGLTGVNLVALSRVLAVISGDDPWQVVRDGARLSLVMSIGTVALGGMAVTLAWAAPALLPFAFMPAAALMFAFRAAAQESEERERSGRLLALSQVLAGRLGADQVLSSFLELTRQAFGADLALAVLDAPDAGTPLTVVDDATAGPARRTASADEQALLTLVHASGAMALRAGLPDGWRGALLAPLEAEGRRLGVVALVTRDRHRTLGSRELTLLTPLASAVAVALQGAAHLGRLVEERSKLKAVVDHSSDGILVLDGSGTVQLWSPAVEILTGRAEATALGRPLAALVVTSGADGAPCDAFLAGRALLSEAVPQATVELTLLRDDGDRRVLRCAHAAVFAEDGALVRDVVLVHDVTREREVERLKADFIATVSHELRTPVTPIKGYADLLRRRGADMSEAKRAECLDIISDRATHLARLVEDLLLASRMSATEGLASTKVDMADDDLAALVRRACGDFGSDGTRVSIDVPAGPVTVSCDPVRVIQVLTNLVGNALKYSGPGSPVRVRLRLDDGQATVQVSDEGRGIPADHLGKVFDKFHRVEDPMRMTTGGTGLGLYIARQLSTAMGGTLSCTSTLHVGSTFSFSLPHRSAVGPPAPAAATPEGPPRPRRTPPWATPPLRPAGAARLSAPQGLG